MATRSRIAIENADGSVQSVYCHWDGYPSNNGQILHDHYQDRAKVEQLISLGSISSLAKEVEAPEGHTYSNPASGVTVAYHRDRGEDVQIKQNVSSQAFFMQDIEEYGYLFTKENVWVIKDGYSAKRQEPQKLSAILDKSELLISGH